MLQTKTCASSTGRRREVLDSLDLRELSPVAGELDPQGMRRTVDPLFQVSSVQDLASRVLRFPKPATYLDLRHSRGGKLTGSTFRDDSGGNRGGSWERTVTTQPIVARTTIRPGMPTPDALTDRFLAWKPFMGKPWRTGCVSCRVSVANRLCRLPGVIKTRQLKQPVRRSSSAAYTPGISRPVRIGVPGTTAAVSLLPPGLRVRWPGWGSCLRPQNQLG